MTVDLNLAPKRHLATMLSCISLPKAGIATVNKASGDNPAIALVTVLGSTPPANVVINEMTTVASVWTNAQFIDGTAIKGQRLACG